MSSNGNFGTALSLLFEASDKSLELLLRGNPSSTLNSTANALADHFDKNEEEIQPIWNLLLKRNDPKSQNRAIYIMRLLFQRKRAKMLNMFVRELKGSDKRRKLGIARVLERILSERGDSGELTIAEMQQLISALAYCIESDSAISKSGTKQPTLLTSVCADLCLTISHRLAVLASQKNANSSEKKAATILAEYDGLGGDLSVEYAMRGILKCIEWLLKIVRELREWRRGHDLMEMGLQEVTKFLEQLSPLSQSDQPLPPESILSRICLYWRNFSEALLSKNTQLSPTRFRKRTHAILTGGSDIVGDQYCRLVSMLLLLGSRDPSIPVIKHLTTSGDDGRLAEEVYTFTLEYIKSRSVFGFKSAFFLLRQLTIDDEAGSYQEALTSILDEPGQVAEELSDALSEIVLLSYPELLDTVFGKLSSTNSGTRQNAMVIIKSVVERMHREKLLDTYPDILDRLFKCLSDEDHETRRMAINCISSLPSDKMIPRVFNSHPHLDARAKLALESAIIEAMHAWGANGILVLLDFIRDTSHSSKDSGGSTISQEQLFQVVSEWASETPAQNWCQMLPLLVDKTYASPSDPLLIRFWSICSLSISRNPDSMHKIIELVYNLMKEQDRLTEELLDASDEESTLRVQRLLFERLFPLLVLKTFPLEAWIEVLEMGELQVENVGCYSDGEELLHTRLPLARLLLEEIVKRCEHPVEFPQVRQVALSLFPRLFYNTVALPITHYKLLKAIRAEKKDLSLIKSWLFAFCSWIVEASGGWSASERGVESIEKKLEWIKRLVRECVLEVLYWREAGEVLQQLQMGAIDTLSLLLTITAPFASRHQRPVIEEIEETSFAEAESPSLADFFSDLLEGVLWLLHCRTGPPPSSGVSELVGAAKLSGKGGEQVETCMANVLIMAAQRLGRGTTSSAETSSLHSQRAAAKKNTKGAGDSKSFRFFFDAVLPKLLEIANLKIADIGNGRSGGVALTACVQLLFHLFQPISSFSPEVPLLLPAPDIADTLAHLFDTHLPLSVRSGAVKWLASILALAKKEVVVELMMPWRVVLVQKGSKAVLEDKTAQSEVKDLARKLESTFFGV
ncbi:uncharacterized protein VTP21DRAFT_10841 [Calcarisporiella thermophila]|uniref:uncharacterized protein n=1 Tax=Calcarisporiella thermophila TaxID=911321 RepID=UPI003742D058